MIYIAPALGLLAGVVGTADTIPYVRDTVGGSTRPQRGTWLMILWAMIALMTHRLAEAAELSDAHLGVS